MSEITSVHHINFVVKNLEKSTRHFAQVLDAEPEFDELEGRQVKTARFNLNGIWLVLVQPLSADSEVGQILEQRGEGLFLLSLSVDSLQNSKSTLQERGVRLADSGPRQGLLDWQVWDLENKAGLGPVVQLCESLKSDK